MRTYALQSWSRYQKVICSIAELEVRPHFTVTFQSQVDLSEVQRVRACMGDRKPSYTAFVAKSVALALREYPYANRRVVRLPLMGTRNQIFRNIDTAIMCERELPDAPMMAFMDVIRNVDALTLTEINDQLKSLAACDETNNRRWREFKTVITRLPVWLARRVVNLPSRIPFLWAMYRGAAVSISSPAKYGVDVVSAVWPWPLGVSFGLVKARPVAVAGRLEPRPTFTLSLNFDRRIMAGAQAARFFKRIVDGLEHAESELTSQSDAHEPATSLANHPDLFEEQMATTIPG